MIKDVANAFIYELCIPFISHFISIEPVENLFKFMLQFSEEKRFNVFKTRYYGHPHYIKNLLEYVSTCYLLMILESTLT